LRVQPFLVAALVLTACAPKDREVRLARVAAEGRNLEVTLDRLEDRLIASQARVRLWRELRERHESVSAISCASQEEHAVAMASHALPPPLTMHHARVAAAAPAGAKTPVRTMNAR
jgi:hypothetical protein